MNGIIPPLITPLVGGDTLDTDALNRLMEHVIAGGVAGVFVLGSTGEGPSLSRDLREQVVRESCRMARGRVPILVSVSDTSYHDSVSLASISADAGAGAVVLAPPYYFRYAQTDLLSYTRRFADVSPLPVYIYNIPGLTKVAYEVETVRAAAQHARIVGLKDSSGDLDYLQRAMKAVAGRRDFSVFIGPEEMLADAMRMGCQGGVCGGANLDPRLFVAIYEAALRGEWAEADRLQARSRAMSAALYTVGDPQSSYFRGIKAACAAAGLCRPTMAPPFVDFSPEELAIIGERAYSVGVVKTSTSALPT